jgi:A118 family predicted phage portal protein
MDSTTSKTATEVVSDKSDTWMTKVNHEHNVKVWIQEIIQLLINAASLYDIQGFKKIKEIGDGENEYQILIKFDDSIIIDDQKNKENDIVLLDKGMLPKYRYLMRNEGLTEEEAKLWIEEADAEMQSMFDDPSDDSEEAEWIENYLMNNPDSNESEARKKYNEQLEG